MTPDPKPKRTKLSPKENHELRLKIYNVQHESCGHESCGKWIPFLHVHVHHIKSRGSGAGDDFDNCVGLCWECHRKIHDGTIRYRSLR